MKATVALILLLGSFSNRVYISGQLKHSGNNLRSSISGRQIFLMHARQLVAKAVTDRQGNYQLDFLDTYDRTSHFKFYLLTDKDTVFLKEISVFESDAPVIDLYLPSKNQ